nr:uncharacterized protein LOC104114361 [Nicotiana tomentosiformis]
MKGGKSVVKTNNMIGVKKNAPVTKKMKEVKMEQMELSDCEEESVHPTNFSNGGGNPCYPHPARAYLLTNPRGLHVLSSFSWRSSGSSCQMLRKLLTRQRQIKGGRNINRRRMLMTGE